MHFVLNHVFNSLLHFVSCLVTAVVQTTFAVISHDVTFTDTANVLGLFSVATVAKCASICQIIEPCRAFVFKAVKNGVNVCTLSDDINNTVSSVGSNLWNRQ